MKELLGRAVSTQNPSSAWKPFSEVIVWHWPKAAAGLPCGARDLGADPTSVQKAALSPATPGAPLPPKRLRHLS